MTPDTSEVLPVLDAVHLRLMLDPSNDHDCELAGELLHARVQTAAAIEQLEDSIPLTESREAVQVAALWYGCIGLGVGIFIGGFGPGFLPGLFG